MHTRFNNIGIRLSECTVGEMIALLDCVEDKSTEVCCCGDASEPIVYYLSGTDTTIDGKPCVTIDYDIITDRNDNDIPLIPIETFLQKKPKSADQLQQELSYEFFSTIFPKIKTLFDGEWDDNPEAKETLISFMKEVYNLKFSQDFIDKANRFFELFREENKEEE